MWALADPELNGYVGSAGTVGEAWPHLQQVCRLERQRVVKGKKQVAVSYAISSLPATDADARRLLSLSRGHWGIENRLHWVRDVTFDEDRSQVRTGAAPQVLAGLRNLVISLVRRAGHSNVAAALRRHNAHLSEALKPSGLGAFGLLVHDLREAAKVESPGQERVWVEEQVKKVSQLDWSNNSPIFKGTLVKGGRAQGSSTAISHAAVVLEVKLGVLKGIPRRTADSLLELFDKGELELSAKEKDSIRMARGDT